MAVHVMVMMKNEYTCPKARYCLKESIQEISSREVLDAYTVV